MITPKVELGLGVEVSSQVLPQPTTPPECDDVETVIDTASTSEHVNTIDAHAIKVLDLRVAYMPGPPAWDILPISPNLVRGMVYPHQNKNA